MSIPVDTPWLVTTLPSTTYRASRTTVTLPRASRVSSDAWWVATRRPHATPASWRSSAPVHTLVIHVARADAAAIQLISLAWRPRGGCRTLREPAAGLAAVRPPGGGPVGPAFS